MVGGCDDDKRRGSEAGRVRSWSLKFEAAQKKEEHVPLTCARLKSKLRGGATFVPHCATEPTTGSRYDLKPHHE